MKHSIKLRKGIILGILLFVSLTSIRAQGDVPDAKQVKSVLSAEQKELLLANRSSAAEIREAFKASLTAEQVEMLQNSGLTLDQKRANLKASLTTGQKQVIRQNIQRRKLQGNEFRNTLTSQQKQMMKRAYVKKMSKNYARPGLKKLPYRTRRWR